ncbi:ParA family protein [Bythopirellula polymerisocia]|uniref:MinD/ParA/CobQ/CobA-like protein n=1 Tax=Bythopirellula polymerisocia TaxID=2528003 RepID=A0A5C6C9G7_9BACT|nr:ParA family protein [Bythopirellula polymerisocia]TWU21363.1 MinD/ParA/CobQ/CobA-like protein [Bythopirellula polymerisocia]
MNITFAHSKGGVTKSALASNLCVWLHRKGHEVAAIDLDAGAYGNKSLTTSVGQAVPEIPIYQPADSKELRVLLPKLAEQFQFTVADAPGGFQSTAQTNIELLKHSDFVLIPVKPEFDAIEPLSVVQQIIEEARLENPLLEARVIINCLDGRTKTGRDPQSIVELIHAICPKLQLMNQKVRIDSSAFQTARINGSVVVEGGRSHAHEDLNALFAELLTDMVVTIGGHSQRLEQAGNS